MTGKQIINTKSTEIVNAQIVETKLGYEDHGILTFYLVLKFNNFNQFYGGYAFDTYNEASQSRIIADGFGLTCISELLKVLNLYDYDSIKGSYVRVECSDNTIRRIGHIINDSWFSFQDICNKFYPKDRSAESSNSEKIENDTIKKEM